MELKADGEYGQRNRVVVDAMDSAARPSSDVCILLWLLNNEVGIYNRCSIAYCIWHAIEVDDGACFSAAWRS